MGSKAAAEGLKLQYNYMSNFQKLHRGIWPWTVGLKSRLPMHYKIRYCELWMKNPKPVYFHPETRKFVPDEFGQPTPVENVHIPITYTPESDCGLWGGEGFVVGLKRKDGNVMKPRVAEIWKPNLLNRVLYSEILDKWIQVLVTTRTLDLIDEAFGFDFYILKTHEVDMKSKFGMKLKRDMLLALARKSLYPNDAAKRESMYNKYKEFIIPEEEAEWVGLALDEAERKQHEIEERERLEAMRPLKEKYFDDLANKLKNADFDQVEESNSFLQKLNPFHKTVSENTK